MFHEKMLKIHEHFKFLFIKIFGNLHKPLFEYSVVISSLLDHFFFEVTIKGDWFFCQNPELGVSFLLLFVIEGQLKNSKSTISLLLCGIYYQKINDWSNIYIE